MNQMSKNSLNMVLRNRKRKLKSHEVEKSNSLITVIIATKCEKISSNLYEMKTDDNLSVGDEVILLNEDMTDFMSSHIMKVIFFNGSTFNIIETNGVINEDVDKKLELLENCKKSRLSILE